MSSDKNTVETARSGGAPTSVTPSTALLNRRIGPSPAPRMLTRSEIDLLRRSAREIAEAAREVFVKIQRVKV